MAPTCTVSIPDINVGNHRLKWNGVELGATNEGSVIAIKQTWKNITIDQLGVQVVGRKLVGEEATINVKLREFTATNINKALPGSDLTTGVVRGGGYLAGFVDGRTAAKPLILHPLTEEDAVVTASWYFPLAHPDGNFSTPMKSQSEKEVPMNFVTYPDTAQAFGKQVWKYGGETWP